MPRRGEILIAAGIAPAKVLAVFLPRKNDDKTDEQEQ